MTRRNGAGAMPAAGQMWPSPVTFDMAANLERLLPEVADEANEVLLAHVLRTSVHTAECAAVA